MRYLILVSHGTFAPGLHNAVGMMAGADRKDIRWTSLLDGMAARFAAALGADTRFFATGSLPESIRRACRTPITYQESLIADGLYAIWQRNKK